MSQDDDKFIHVPKPDIPVNPKPFADLLSREEDLVRVFDALEQAIWKSFGVDVQREPFKPPQMTGAEIKRRFQICERWFREARADRGYSLERTLDLMAQALRCELDGVEFDPETGPRIWTPT